MAVVFNRRIEIGFWLELAAVSLASFNSMSLVLLPRLSLSLCQFAYLSLSLCISCCVFFSVSLSPSLFQFSVCVLVWVCLFPSVYPA